MRESMRHYVNNSADIMNVAKLLLGTCGSIETLLAEEAMRETTLDASQTRSYKMPGDLSVDFADLESFLPPLGGPEIFFGHLQHPYEEPRAFSDTYNFFANMCRWSEFISPGDFVIDIGAHSGDTTLVLAALVGVSGMVLAFDPNPAVIPTLYGNSMMNDSYEIEVEGKAVAMTNGTLVFSDHGNLMCNGGLLTGLEQVGSAVVDKIESLAPTLIDVEAVRLDDYLTSRSDRFGDLRVSFIKTDCEGFDALIVESLLSILDRDRPTLFVEWFEWFNREESQLLFASIERVGYQAFDPFTLQLANVDHKVSDLLCLPRKS